MVTKPNLLTNPAALLSEEIQSFLVRPEQVAPPCGSPTGIAIVDDFLLWKGLPKGDISLFQGAPGTGSTSLWISSIQKAHQKGAWAAWINGNTQLLPSHLKSRKVELEKLLVVEKPDSQEKLVWILQELISSSLFEVIGCEFEKLNLKNHQLQKIKKLCRMHKVALVFVSHQVERFINPLYGLVLQFGREFITVKRALHRPTPFTFPGSLVHESALPQLAHTARKLLR